MPQRLALINQWLQNQLRLRDYDIQPASSDASFRRYFRISAGSGEFVPYRCETLVVMDAPPERENTAPYIRIARMMAEMGLNVPRVLEQDKEQGFLLLSDLGATQYLSILNDANVNDLYGDALAALLKLQTHSADACGDLPRYDRALLLRELNIFVEWYLQKHLGLELSQQQQKVIDDALEIFIASALQQPQVCVHRDYHSRNLMYTKRDNPGILDFQDAVTGPVTYDLVSLLRDCYIAWPREQVENWALQHRENLQQADVIVDVSSEQFLRWFDLMGAQRHLKATGIFARLNHRDGKPDYLKDIPRTLSYVLDVSGRYNELAALNRLLTSVMPSS
ncbi:MAG: phosphotransferase [Gammaproteobacteria bacterium]|jgi:aminoglycoside/choline kinase family phosphotransferase